MDEKESRFRKKYIIAGVLSIILLCGSLAVHFMGRNYEKKEPPKVAQQTDAGVFVEEEREDKIKINTEIEEKSELRQISNPHFFKVKNEYYYLFDDDILLPLDGKTWTEFGIVGNGIYSDISEFYVKDEDEKSWTQKFVIHKLKVEDKNCFNFVEKLINGIIANVDERLELSGTKFSKEMLSFNYVKKDENNTLMFWTIKIPDQADETQYVRCFIAPYSQNMYIVYYTLKTSDLAEAENISNIQNINKIQELKKQ